MTPTASSSWFYISLTEVLGYSCGFVFQNSGFKCACASVKKRSFTNIMPCSPVVIEWVVGHYMAGTLNSSECKHGLNEFEYENEHREKIRAETGR
jgi:hypothetical protein